jgi:hypothetical protein
MPHLSRKLRRTRVTSIAIAALIYGASAAATASAGTYDYVDSNPCAGGWQPTWTDPSRIAQYPECPNIVVRNSLGDFRTPNGTSGGWSTSAPAGTAFVHAKLEGDWLSGPSWKSYIGSSNQIEGFCDHTCGGFDQDLVAPASAVTIGVGCFDGNGCPNSGGSPRAWVYLQRATLRVLDSTPPNVSISGGSAVASGWIGGKRTLTVNASDNTGIKTLWPTIDGRRLTAQEDNLPCDYTRPLPCGQANGAGVPLDVSGVSEGAHRLGVIATDTGGNDVTSAERSVKVDNTPPGPPVNTQLIGGPGWRSSNGFSVTWTNPAQTFAPVGGANYRLCPAGAPLTARSCVSGYVAGTNLSGLESIKVPGRGAWTMRLWLYDGAGNARVDNGVTIDGLGFDDTPPTGLAIEPINPADPARVTVRASDPDSGIANGSIELRRKHGKSWRAIKTQVTSTGLTGVIADGRLPRGRYRVRALATNPAALTAATAQRTTGRQATVKLPLRTRARLVAGRRHGDRLRRSTRLRIGRSATIKGRLTAHGEGLRRRLTVSQRVSVQGARYRRVASVRTNRHGRFAYEAPAGAARTLRFAYAGGAHISDARATVRLRVQARLRLRVNDHSVRNGEYVTLTGRLRGGQIPPSGAQLALQFFGRGHWRAFATPRTGPHGRFRYQYRFETVQGRARFRFRAVLLKGATYPYEGRSNTVRVTVRGL